MQEYRFDRDHNSPFRLARTLRDRPAPTGRPDPARQASAIRALERGDPPAQRQALATLQELGPAALQAAAPILLKLAGEAKDPSIREAVKDIIRKAFAPAAYSRAEIAEIQRLCECRATATASRRARPTADSGSPSSWPATAARS